MAARRAGVLVGLIGGAVPFLYGVIPTYQTQSFGRTYAAYGGFFVTLSLLWGWGVEGRRPDAPDFIGALICLAGVGVIMYWPGRDRRGGVAVSLVLFRERPTAFFLTGAALMALGVWLHLTERHAHEHHHEAMEHEHAHVHDEHHQHVHGRNDPAVADPVPHSHWHRHEPMAHTHPHYPDLHHRHSHDAADAREHAEPRVGPGAPE
jgi:drug/metabolite transporter superfamily protein YnfA